MHGLFAAEFSEAAFSYRQFVLLHLPYHLLTNPGDLWYIEVIEIPAPRAQEYPNAQVRRISADNRRRRAPRRFPEYPEKLGNSREDYRISALYNSYRPYKVADLSRLLCEVVPQSPESSAKD